MTIEQTNFSPKSVIESINDMLQLKAKEKGISLNIEIDQSIPDALTGDPTRLQQILLNLTGNAVKFTEKGYVLLKASLTDTANNRYNIQFDVIDTGIGITEEYRKQLFESFTQASSDTTRKFGGTGLGLAISKQLTELMKGSISVSSEPGKGSCFTVQIPFSKAGSKQESQQGERPRQQALQRLSRSSIPEAAYC
jgi:signal transduction histidine kinase